jgi:RNA polymerase sigma-70 factor, ECF subfamily
VKDEGGSEHRAGVEAAAALESPSRETLDVTAIHAAHADFVWSALQRFGVRDRDLEDALQEVFVVVHRRLDSYDGTSKVTTWLYGIAMRVAAAFRRKAHVRRERETRSDEEMPEQDDDSLSPEELAARQQARATLETILDGMDLDRRAVFVMFEVEELSCEEIAGIVGVPVGTVYSRLHKARKEFAAAVERMKKRGAR